MATIALWRPFAAAAVLTAADALLRAHREWAQCGARWAVPAAAAAVVGVAASVRIALRGLKLRAAPDQQRSDR